MATTEDINMAIDRNPWSAELSDTERHSQNR